MRNIQKYPDMELNVEYTSFEEELESTDEDGLPMGLDIGVASAAATLSTARIFCFQLRRGCIRCAAFMRSIRWSFRIRTQDLELLMVELEAGWSAMPRE